MKKKKGRKLLSLEIVHHKDGNDHNDLPSNLQLIKSQSNHAKIPRKKRKIEIKLVKNLAKRLKEIESYDFYYALKTLFSPRQFEIIMRKSNNQKLSKTEIEIFSRIIKKKLRALANEQVFNLCRSIINNS